MIKLLSREPFKIGVSPVNLSELRCPLCNHRIMPIDGNTHLVRCVDCTWIGSWWDHRLLRKHTNYALYMFIGVILITIAAIVVHNL
jgi:hypothetical protein